MNSIQELIVTDYPTIDENEPLSMAIPMMSETDGIVIMHDGTYKGMLNTRDISRAKLSPETKAKTVMKNVAKLSANDALENTAGFMLESDSYVLPVFEKRKLRGVVTAHDVLKKAVEQEFGEEQINKYITTPVINITPEDTVSKALKIFKEEDISTLPVCKNNALSGVLTMDAALAMFTHPEHRQGGSGQYDDVSKYGAAMADKKEYLDLPVKGIMSETVTMMAPDDKVKEIVTTMASRKVKAMLIGENDQVEGIVTKRDLLEPLATYVITEPIVIQFSGELEKIQGFTKQRPKDIIYSNFKKYLDYLDNAHIYVRLKRHTEQSKGKHIIFCKMRLSSPRGMFVAAEEGWGYLDAINKACEALERQIKKGKRR